MSNAEYEQQTRASNAQINARAELYDLFDTSPLPCEDLLVNLSLYNWGPEPHLAKGNALAFDELNAPEYTGETVVVAETLDLTTRDIFRSSFLPDRFFMIIR